MNIKNHVMLIRLLILLMESEQPKFDVIVIGLSCVGLSAVYHLSKKGYRVLGLERYGESGALGTASHGEARLWRLRHEDKRYTEMMQESLGLWKELENTVGK